MKKLTLFVSLFVLLTRFVQAGSVQVVQWVPWNFVQTEFNKIPLNIE